MSEMEQNKSKDLDVEKMRSTAGEGSKDANKKKPEPPTPAAPKKSVWDLPNGEYSEVFDSEGHRNRINHY